MKNSNETAAIIDDLPERMTKMALAHTIGSNVEAAYRRGDLFEKRRELMLDCAKHCDPQRAGKVLPMRERFRRHRGRQI